MLEIIDSQSITDISIIIVSWNTHEMLCQCIESIYANTKKKTYEIIVVDNASTDGSPKTVANQFPQVELIKNNDNLGFAKANNIGFQKSKGRYVCFVNSDVIVQNSCIEKLADFMDANPSWGMSGPKILNPDGTLQVSCRHFPTIWNNLCQTIGLNKIFPRSAFFSEPLMKYWPHDETRKIDVLSGCFWMVRREALDKVGLLDEDFFIYGEDMDWCHRFHNAGWDVVFYPGAEAIHARGASSSNAPIRFYLEMQKADLQYWEKYHGALGRILYAGIIFIRHLLRTMFNLLVYMFRPSKKQSASFKLKRSLACISWLFTGRYKYNTT